MFDVEAVKKEHHTGSSKKEKPRLSKEEIDKLGLNYAWETGVVRTPEFYKTKL